MSIALSYAIKYVADMDQAVRFHRDVLGLTLKFQSPYWTEFVTGDTTLALHPASAENPPGRVELGFSTPDLAALYAARETNGINFTAPPRPEHGRLLTRFTDSEGAPASISGPGG